MKVIQIKKKKKNFFQVYMNINGWEFNPKGLAYGSIGYFLRFERKFTAVNDDS